MAAQTGRDWKLSERKACRFLGFSRTSCRRRPREQRVADAALIAAILLQVKSTPRLGCRKTLRMICRKRGWVVNHKRGARVWKQLRLNAQRARTVRKRAKGSSENACSVLRAMRARHVFSWDFVFDATEGGSQLKWLSITDEYTHECLALEVEWSMDSAYVLEIIMRVVSRYGAPEFIRSDNGGEFIAQRLKTGLAEIGVEVKCIEPGAPWQNGYSESFHGQLRAELLDMEVFGSLAEARGALLVTLAKAGLRIEEYSPAEVKSAVTGSGRAEKTQVARMVGLLLGVSTGAFPVDATDALAVALCSSQRQGLRRLVALGAASK